MQQIKDCDKLSALAYPKPLQSLEAITSDANVREYLNELQNNGRKLTCFVVHMGTASIRRGAQPPGRPEL